MGTGPQEAELKQQARRLGLANVSFLGALPESDKVALYKLCHAFVFPSHIRSEAFGVALVEAAMHGKPMISCEIGTGTTFINLDKVTGIAVPPANPGHLRRAMDDLWNDPSMAETYGRHARQRYRDGRSEEHTSELQSLMRIS